MKDLRRGDRWGLYRLERALRWALPRLARFLRWMLRQITRFLHFWSADVARRRSCVGKAASLGIGLFVIMFACSLPLAIVQGAGQALGVLPTRQPATARPGQAAALAARPTEDPREQEPTRTPRPTETPRPTQTPPPTATPVTPPVGVADRVANLRSAPVVAPETVLGAICPGDTLIYVSRQQVGSELWYQVQLTALGAECDAGRAALGSEGWAAASVIAAPSYAVEAYADAVGLRLPTAIPPTATPRPAPRPTSPPARGNCHPSYPDVCIPGGPDLDCPEVPYRRFTVVGSDPHGFDRDNDGIGCES